MDPRRSTSQELCLAVREEEADPLQPIRKLVNVQKMLPQILFSCFMCLKWAGGDLRQHERIE